MIVVRDSRRREGAAGLEDGTSHFLGIAALRHGFAAIRRAGGFPAVDEHTSMLTRSALLRDVCVAWSLATAYCVLSAATSRFSPALIAAPWEIKQTVLCRRHTVQQLTSLRHFNGRPVAEVYTGQRVAAAALSPALSPRPAERLATPADTFASVAHTQQSRGGRSGSGGGSNSRAASVATYGAGSTLAATSFSGTVSTTSLATSVATVTFGSGSASGERDSSDSSDSNGSGSGGAGAAIIGQGPTVAFNLRRADGSWVGYRCSKTCQSDP